MTRFGAIRVLILGVFAAAGVGLAVSLAIHTDVPEHSASATPASKKRYSRTAADSPAETREVVATAAAQLPPITPPERASTLPIVADSTVSDLVDLLKSMSDQNRGVLDTARELLQSKNQPLEGPAQAQPVPSSRDAELPGPATPEQRESSIRDEGDNRLEINIRDTEITEVLELLSVQSGLNILTMPGVKGPISATMSGVDAHTALLQLTRIAGLIVQREGDFYYVGTKQDLEQLRRSQERMITRVYRPNYVTAAELQKLITPMLSQGGQANVSTSATVAAAASQPGGAQVVTSSPATKGIAPSNDQAGSDDFAGNEVLLVRDYESVMFYVDQIVAEVDQRPLQVALESMILSVRLDDENALGVNLELLRNKENVRLVSGLPMDDLASLDFSDGALKFGFLDSNISSFISALESVGDTNVIASPRLMCLNKQRAEILIGSQLGYVSTTVTETAATQSVEFLEVGTQLRFRPYIGSDGLIRLEVHPELSTGNVRVEQGVTLPDKDVTQVTTNIMCHDGCTVIIGGLIREDLSSNSSRIPVLGSIPLVGPLFRFNRDTMDRREIIVLLTPHIVRDPIDYKEASQAQAEFLQRQENFADKMSVIGRRHYGLHYLRHARAAWNAGDYDTALRYVNLSIHFDPMNREATVLHRRILAALPPGTDTIDSHLRQGTGPFERPWTDYSEQGVPWQSTPIVPYPLPTGSVPGETAPRRDLEHLPPVHGPEPRP